MQNDSTVKLIKDSLVAQTRHHLLVTNAALLCKACGEVKTVVDVFPNGEVKLSCEHRRPLNYRKAEDVAAYNAAVEAKRIAKEGVPVGREAAA